MTLINVERKVLKNLKKYNAASKKVLMVFTYCLQSSESPDYELNGKKMLLKFMDLKAKA